MSGWGKSWYAQLLFETNLPEFDYVGIFDYKDEYRGLVKAGLASHYIVGERETAWSVDDWETFFESNPKVVLARHRLKPEEWRDVVADAVQALRNLAGPKHAALAGIDEAHFVAPQSGKIPDAVEGLATTGRGEGASSMWITQRLAKLDETVGSQCDERLVGGFPGTVIGPKSIRSTLRMYTTHRRGASGGSPRNSASTVRASPYGASRRTGAQPGASGSTPTTRERWSAETLARWTCTRLTTARKATQFTTHPDAGPDHATGRRRRALRAR